MQTIHKHRLKLAGLASGLLLTACGGGGAGSGDFQLIQISVPQNGEWQINRPIEFEFSQPVDFSTVDSNSITIRTPNGQAALGQFSVKQDANGNPVDTVVVFQPRCPLQADFSDAGLLPGGQSYSIEVIGADVSIGLSVGSQAGDVLALSQLRTFSTAVGTLPSELFIDSQIGAPLIVVRDNTVDTDVEASYIRLREDDSQRFYFERTVDLTDPDLPAGAALGQVIVEPFSADERDFPINLFSDPAQQIDIVLVFNQSVSPALSNISTSRIVLQSRTPADESAVPPVAAGPWVERPADIALEANCTTAGARVRVRPVGILPQEQEFRVVVSADFADIVGDQGLLAQTEFNRFATQGFQSPFGDSDPDPDTIVDEFFESFTSGSDDAGSYEDAAPETILPLASWGNGQLRATYDFDGTGGPGGDFDWEVPAGETLILSTDLSQITGGPGFVPTATQPVVNGLINVRDMRIQPGAKVLFVGPNPVQIFATGTVEILGEIDISGVDNKPVAQLNSPNIPQPGAAGTGGGGFGGRGSPLTTTSTPKGEDGFGAFGVAGGGGVGGESAFLSSASPEQRRGAGGGGGRLAADFNPATDNGLDVNAELGGPGSGGATSAVTKSGPAQPGALGPPVFSDLNPDGSPNDTNDFFGIQNESGDGSGTLISGELVAPTAGSGGGGGGDNINSPVFPATEFVLNKERKGGGGGGGGGQLQILALENVKLGAQCKIVSNGGRGGEGESTGGTNQVGGAGGGGSAGHIIIQAGGQLDLSEDPGIRSVEAVGGEGGVGQSDGNNEPPNVALSSGGDGGGGLIQFHVAQFTSAVALGSGEPGVVLPGGQSNVGNYLNTISTPNAKRLVPTFRPQSVARSIPVPLGSLGDNTPSIPPLYALLGVETADDGLTTEFDESGSILRASNVVTPTAPILSGTTGASTPAGVSLSAIDFDNRVVTLELDAAAITALNDDTNGVEYCYDVGGNTVPCGDAAETQRYSFRDISYIRNPALLREALLTLDDAGPASAASYSVAMVVFDPIDEANPAAGVRLHLMLSSEGSLVNFLTADLNTVAFSLSPRSFRVSTNGIGDELLDSQTIRIQAQLLTAKVDGTPDLENTLTPFTGDFAVLSSPNVAAQADFIRFEVFFDLGENADGNTPRPVLEFLRIPLQF
ncbi:MAG: CIA30 family protein [Planctomycetota bacterium]|jgi:hypothetical protein